MPLDGIWQANHKRAQRTHSVEYGYRPDIWEISQRDITIKELMSEGFFGEVYRGVVKGPLKANTHLSPMLRNEPSISVAVKYLKCKSFRSTFPVIIAVTIFELLR